MKRARIIGMAIAGGAAIAAMLLMYAVMGRTKERTVKVTVNTTEVLVAKADIKLGDVVKSADFKWLAWPQDAATAGYITKSGDANADKKFDGALARSAFLANEPIRPGKLIKANEGGVMAAILPAGKRAISTKIEEFTGVAGFIMPNDRVDVIRTGKDSGAGGRKQSYSVETILKNVRVLAIGQVLEGQDAKDGKKGAIAARTATLELSPSQAERLALERSTSDSTISLVLRPLAEQLGQVGAADDEPIKKEEPSGVKMLRYGSWSRVTAGN
jgi:pilus assembly protein CpaB